MRAIFNDDPHAGAGYGTIDIYGAAGVVEPCLIIRRMSDGRTLSQGGWRSGVHDITPLRSETVDDFLRVWLGPDVVNEISPEERYELEMPGSGKCALHIHALMQSVIVANNGVGLTPPPPDPLLQDADDFPPAEKIYEGVEETPQILPDEPFESASGVAAEPERMAQPDRQPKRRGCMLLGALLAAVWVGVGILLWQGAMNAPAGQDAGFSLEIIPKSKETSIANDPGDDGAQGEIVDKEGK